MKLEKIKPNPGKYEPMASLRRFKRACFTIQAKFDPNIGLTVLAPMSPHSQVKQAKKTIVKVIV